jgi:pyruvate/2-oxoglutarate dehydrogenase complex dihydrolipoamide acyltransferase (E2) component
MQLVSMQAGAETLFDFQQRVMAHKTIRSWEEIPHAGLVFDLDLTDVVRYIAELKAYREFRDVRITLNSFVIKMIAEAVQASPALNAHISYNRKRELGSIRYCQDVNIAVPTRLRDGRTIAVVLKQANSKTLREVCLAMEDMPRRLSNTNVDCMLYEGSIKDTIQRLKRLEFSVLRRIYANFVGKTKVRLPSRRELRQYRAIPDKDKITAEDFFSATLLVSNIGSLIRDMRVHIAFLEIIPPQAAVIGLGTLTKQPVVMTDAAGKDTIQIRQILPVSLYVDHKALAMHHVLGFLQKMSDLAKNPRTLWEGDSTAGQAGLGLLPLAAVAYS